MPTIKAEDLTLEEYKRLEKEVKASARHMIRLAQQGKSMSSEPFDPDAEIEQMERERLRGDVEDMPTV